MPAAHKGAIAFGLVYIPIEMWRTTKDVSISFNQLHKKTHERIRYKKVTAGSDIEVTQSDIVKGYQFRRDEYVVMTDAEIEKIKTPLDKTINIILVTDFKNIDPIYFEKNYYAIPDGSTKAFNLLLTVLRNEKKIAIAKTVIGTKENLLALCPTDDGLIIKTLFFQDEIVKPPKVVEASKLSKEEMSMAKLLINSLEAPFVPDNYEDEYQARLKEAIEQKVSGRKIVQPNYENMVTPKDLIDALKLSIETNSKAKKKPTKKKKSPSRPEASS